MKRYLLLLFLLWMSSASGAADKSKQGGKDLIEQAEAKTNIFALPSFEMKASIRVDHNGNPLDGSYLLLWDGPAQWREEISLPGYSEVRVGGKGVIFLKRSTDFMPLEIYRLRSTLGYGSGESSSLAHVMPGPGESVRKIHQRKINDSDADCAEVDYRGHYAREVCVDRMTGAIVRQSPFLDRELLPVGTKLFPHFLSYVGWGKPWVEIRVSELRTTEQFPPSAFDPPSGAESRPGCMNPDRARLVKKVQPPYPERERQSHVQGLVAISALIEKDGVPHRLRIISGPTPGLNKMSLDAVQQWRYEPATCNGIEVEVETVITVIYSLQ